MDFRSFLFERHEDNFFVELARLIVLFRVGLDCFVSRRTWLFCVRACAFVNVFTLVNGPGKSANKVDWARA